MIDPGGKYAKPSSAADNVVVPSTERVVATMPVLVKRAVHSSSSPVVKVFYELSLRSAGVAFLRKTSRQQRSLSSGISRAWCSHRSASSRKDTWDAWIQHNKLTVRRTAPHGPHLPPAS